MLSYIVNTTNTYTDLMKQAMYITRDNMKCDALFTYIVAQHDPEIIFDELKFKPAVQPINWYMMNYSFGEREIKNQDLNYVML